MNKIFKSRIFTLLMGAFIVVGIDAIADTTLIDGNKISYSNSTSRLSSTNMQGAMDELYDLAKHTSTYTMLGNEKIKDLGDYHHYKKIDATNVYNAGYNEGRTSLTGGNAGAGNILIGYSAYVNGILVNGSMPNRGELNWKPSIGTTKTVQAGYYSGGTLDSRDAYNNGYNAGVAAGKTTHTDNYVLSATELTKDFGIYHSYKSVDATNVYNAGVTNGKSSVEIKWDITKNVSGNDEFEKTITNPLGRDCKVYIQQLLFIGQDDDYPIFRFDGTDVPRSWDSGTTYDASANSSIYIRQWSQHTTNPDRGGYWIIIWYG